ncbi:gamma-tubulin complex component protein [Blakeslea trispora]|nr:gamma-tubulin complex component protein [Blakeslea trispora]
MLHELLFVLLGYPGDVFMAYPPHQPKTFAIPSSFPLLHPSERQCLDRLGQLGWTFRQIHQFIQRTKQHKRGAYLQACVTCLDSTLNDYRHAILELETGILNKQEEFGQGIVPLSWITAHLSDWQLLLPALVGLVNQLEEAPEQYHGCRLFGLLMDQAKTGLEPLKAVLDNMIHQLNSVFYRQLTAWMIYGQRVDPDHEFFIVPSSEQKGRWQQYKIDADRMPPHLSHHLAESILFVGKAIATVHALQQIKIPMTMRQRHLQLLQQPHDLVRVVHQIRRSTADWLFSQVLVGEDGLHAYLKAFRQVFLLDYGDFATHFIDECLSWRLRLSNDNRGALLFYAQEINALLIKASVGTEAEDGLDGFRLLLERTEEYPFADLLLSHVPMVMTFELTWPIDLFLSPSDLKQYSHLWSFLISLKATQMALNSLWKLLRHLEKQQEQAVWQLRSHMLFWVDTFWSHIQIYVIDTHYQRLIQATQAPDFEAIQTAHAQFLTHTTRGCLLGSSCVKTLYEIIKTCLDFCQFMERMAEEQEEAWIEKNEKKKKKRKTASEIVQQWTQTEDDPPSDHVKQWQETFDHLTQRFFASASHQPPEVKSSGQIDSLLMQLDFNGWFSRT